MELRRPHGTTRDEAVETIDGFLDDLMTREFPYGVRVANPEKDWHDDTMDFQFKLKKGILGVTVSGKVEVDEESASLSAEVPKAIEKLVSKDKIAEVIARHFDRLFERGEA